jgi:hypothetical protein
MSFAHHNWKSVNSLIQFCKIVTSVKTFVCCKSLMKLTTQACHIHKCFVYEVLSNGPIAAMLVNLNTHLEKEWASSKSVRYILCVSMLGLAVYIQFYFPELRWFPLCDSD